MAQKNTKSVGKTIRQPISENQRTFENILDEYKVISLQLFEQSDKVQKTDSQWEFIASEQARLLDAQQALLVEAQSMKVNSGKDVFALIELWKADEVYSKDISPSQGIVLHLQDYFKRKSA